VVVVAEKRVQRRLAAILAADVVGYSRLIRADEEATLARLNSLRKEVIDPCIAQYDGRIVKLMGDGLLAEFPSAVDAVRNAVEVQTVVAEHQTDVSEDRRIIFRVGVNLGDVVIDADDIHGDGVNVAARLEGLAEPGGICISGKVYEEVRDRIDLPFEDLGEREVKNISRPVRAWRWSNPKVAATEAVLKGADAQTVPMDRPSIAVLPFQMMDSRAESNSLLQGLTEDLTTAMSHFPWLSVPARHLAFAYDGAALDLKQAGRDLGVRYLLEGSLRRSANHLRVNAQLIDASTGNHLWAKRYDIDREDVFEQQDEIVSHIATTLGTEIMLAEIARARAKPPGELEAWDYYLIALAHYHAVTPEDEVKARELLERCITLEPEFVMAHALLAACHGDRALFRWTRPAGAAWNEAEKVAERAIKLDRTHPDANSMLSFVYRTRGMAKEGIAAARRALEANPYDVSALAHLGSSLAFAGEPEEALKLLAPRLWGSPRNPWFSYLFFAAGIANFSLENFEEALAWCDKAVEQDPGRRYGPYAFMAASLGHLGRLEEANRAVAQLLRIVPTFSLSVARKNPMFIRPVDAERLIEGLRLAGLPE
jgi:adenylate cyclase